MTTLTELDTALARAAVYGLMSNCFLYPEAGRLDGLRTGCDELLEACRQLEWTELAKGLGELRGQLQLLDYQGLSGEYLTIFGHTIATDCPPYESEYGQGHVFQKSQTLADLGTFYQSFGVGPNPELRERLDHISVELEFMNLLYLKEAYAIDQGHGSDKVSLCRQAQEGFLANHLAGWINSFLHHLDQRANSRGFYAAAGRSLRSFLTQEFARFRLQPEPADTGERPEPEEELECAGCPMSEETIGPEAFIPLDLITNSGGKIAGQ